MNEARKVYRLAAKMLVSVIAISAGPLLAQPAAFAAGNLSSVVLPNTFPGLVPATSGSATNGPLTSGAMQYLPIDEASGAKLLVDLGSGKTTGYVRAWTRQPPNGDGIFIYALRYSGSTDQASWLRDVDSGFKAQSGIVTFPVPGIAGAQGYTAHVPSSTGPATSVNLATFEKGDLTFLVIVSSSSGDLTSANAVTLATEQAAKAPANSTNHYVKIGEIAGGALLAIILMVLIVKFVRRDRKHLVPHAPQPTGVKRSVVSYPPLPTEPQEPGWAMLQGATSIQWHWDGKAWTGRRQLTPAGWVED